MLEDKGDNLLMLVFFVLLDTVHVPSPVMLATPFVYTPTPTVTMTDSVHVTEKVYLCECVGFFFIINQCKSRSA